MATYVPFTLITPKSLGISTSISTWESHETVSGTVHRTTVLASSGAPTVALEMGATGAQTGTQQFAGSAIALTANVPTVYNWWIAVPVGSYFHGYASTGVPAANGVSSGYLTS